MTWVGLAEDRNQYLAVFKGLMYILVYKMRVSLPGETLFSF